MTDAYIILALFLLFIFFSIIKWRRKRNAGEDGEKTVARILSKLPKEEYKVINDLLLQDSGHSSQIDHVVVSVYGVFVIETKNFTGDISGGPNSEFWTQNVFGSKSSFRNPIWQNQGHIAALRKVLSSIYRGPYFNIVVFSERARLQMNLPGVFNWRKIRPIIEGYTDKVMTYDATETIYNTLVKANITDRKARKEHLAVVKNAKEKRDIKVAKGICPRCGGELVLRNGKYGQFYGCSNYPKCNYITK